MASTWASKCPRHWQRVEREREREMERAKKMFAPYFQRISIVNLIVHLSATDRCEIQVYNSYAVSPGTRGASWTKILNRLGAQVGRGASWTKILNRLGAQAGLKF